MTNWQKEFDEKFEVSNVSDSEQVEECFPCEGGFCDMSPTEIKSFISQVEANAIQEGYNRGRLRCLQQHYGKELEEQVNAAIKRTKEGVRKTIEANKEKWAQGLVYLVDKDIENQWQAAEAHLKIILDDLLSSDELIN